MSGKNRTLVAVSRSKAKGFAGGVGPRWPEARRNASVELMQVESRPVRSLASRNTSPLQIVAARSPGGQVTAEDGYFDTERSTTAISVLTATWAGSEMDPNTTAMLCLFAPVQGDDISNRRARKVFVKKIRICGRINMPEYTASATSPASPVIRILVFMDKQSNGAQVSPATLMASGDGSQAGHMFQSTAGFGRFKVFKDKSYVLNPTAVYGPSTGALIGGGAVCREFSFTIKPNVWVNYNATNGGTVADIIDNSFHLACLTNRNTPAAPTIEYKARTVFTP